MRASLATLLVTVFFTFIHGSVAGIRAQADEVSLQALVNEMVSLERLTSFPSPPYIARQTSSYDRAANDPENMKTWFANGDRGHYLRVEERSGRKEFVMLDAAGPGVVTRIWSANPGGTLRIYIDGAAMPALEAPMADLLRGRVKPFVGHVAYEAARGCNIYFPFSYSRHCKITSDRGDFYYQVGYRTYEKGTGVESYSAAALASVGSTLKHVLAVLDKPAQSYSPGQAQNCTKFRLAVSKSNATSKVSLTARSGGEAIRKLVMRPSITKPEVLRKTILSIRFDGHKTVEAPLGDFFGSAPGLNPYTSLPLSVSADESMTSRWVMPFRKSAVLELRGGGIDVVVNGEVCTEPYAWNERSLYFNANWTSTHDMKTNPPRDWNYVEIEGRGIYAGNVLTIANPVRAWWGEGDEKIYIDGEKFPSHFGTGTEDYYGYAWCCPDLFTRPYHNQTRCDGPGNFGHTSINRWHVLDDLPFTKKFRFDMEVWHWDRRIKVSYDNVNYWYASAGARSNTRPLDLASLEVPVIPERKVKIIPGAIEGEKMKVLAASGSAETQDLAGFGEQLWSRDAHKWWRGAKPGDKLVLEFAAPRAGRHRVIAHLTKARDYGIHKVSINGKSVGDPIDLYDPQVVPAPPMDLGVFELTKEGNTIEVVIAGINPKAGPKNYMFGLDCIVLKEE